MRRAISFLPLLSAALSASVALFALASAASPAVARAAEETEYEKARDSKGIELGVRTGAGLPVGTTYGTNNQFVPFNGGGAPGVSVQQSRAFTDAYAAMVPIIFDVGYRVGRLYLGPWIQYGFAVPTGSACPSGFSCSASDVRFGIAGDWHFLRRATWDPWLGVGFGYEWTSFHGSGNGTALDESLRGFELFQLEGGLDWDVARTPLRLGGFVMASFAQFTDFTSTQNGATSEGKVSDLLGQPEPHGWFIFGVRGRLDL